MAEAFTAFAGGNSSGIDWSSIFAPHVPLLEGFVVTDGLVVVVTMIFWSVAVDALAYWFPGMGRWLKARPRTLIEDGKVNRKLMRREFMTVEEIRSQLRLHGIDDIAVVDRAYLEPNGMISVVRRDREETGQVEPPDIL